MSGHRLRDWLTSRRWYAGHGRELLGVRPRCGAVLPGGLQHLVLEAVHRDGVERYQAIVRWSDEPGSDAGWLGRVGGRHAVDVLEEPRLSAGLLGALFGPCAGTPAGRLEPGAALPPAGAGRAIGTEQSNTSVVFGETAVLKLFRRVQPGTNADLEVTRALTRAGSTDVPALLGSVETSVDGRPVTVAMLSAYVGGAVDGWTHVTADGAPAGPAGGANAFAADAAALGRSLGRVHRALAGAFGTGPAPRAGDRPADGLRRRLGERLERAIAGTDELRPFAARLRRRVDRLGLGGPPLQRVHGDLHLGQVLRGPAGWHLIDFEGEPGRPAPECRRLDSPLRDVAGMLRSLDYAAAFVAGVPPTGPAEAYDAWSAGSAEALCLGYAEVTGTDPRSQPELLAAYLLDKLVYEVAYEARHRPGWLPVPMRALRRMFPAA